MCNCVNCQNKTLGHLGAITDCICTDCQPAGTTQPIPGSTGSTSPASTINIYNTFSPLNLDAPVYVYPDGTYSNIPPGTGTLPGTGGGTTLPPPEEETGSAPGGSTTTPPAPPVDENGNPLPTTTKPFPWFLLLALGYAGYQVLKKGKPERKKRRARA